MVAWKFGWVDRFSLSCADRKLGYTGYGMALRYICSCGRVVEIKAVRDETISWECPSCFIRRRPEWWRDS